VTGVRFVDQRSSLDEVMERMDPVVERWFRSRFDSLTAPQATAIPLIDERRSTLISSPTGSGKTITAFLSVINHLFRLNQLGELEDRIYCVYVSPLKALANDIHKNLEVPLEEIQEMARNEGLSIPDIRVAVRSGDTTTAERQRMVKRPPHIFITTPESLSLVLSTRKFSEKFAGVEWVIIDEIHDLCSSKRGTLLSLALEHLQARVGEPLTRVGLSATQAPIEEIAGFLVGFEEDEIRDVDIVQVNPDKEIDLKVLIPVDDLEQATYKDAEAEMHKMLVGLVKEHQTTLIFTNTRAATESLVMKLKELGIQHVAAHHGSMSKEKRLDVERSLKRGQLQAIVSSTSLELGIDIGSIDLVVQIGSPKSISKLMQRIGRSGHSLYRVTKGRVVALDPMELEECTVLVHSALLGEVDLVRIPRRSLDVLSQFLVGLAIVEPWSIDHAYELVRSSYPYRNLSRDDFDRVLESLGEVARLKHRSVYAKLWIDWENGRFGSKQGARLIYFTNVGTIPEESTWRVFSEKGVPLGNLSERFIERVRPKEVFVLGGKTYEFIQTKGTKVFVRDAHGRKPTIPSWAGEAMSRSRELAIAVTRLRDQMSRRMADDTQSEVVDWLCDEYHLDRGLALNLISQYRSQLTVSGHIPSANRFLVEGYTDVRGDPNVIIHTSLGRSVNEVLARICAVRVARNHSGLRVRTVLDDDSFALLLDEEVDPKEVAKALRKAPLEKDLREVLPGSELFHQRFRHCSTRAFLVLRNYRGREVPIARQHQQAARLYDDLVEDEDFPVTMETYEESLHQAMDLDTAEAVVKELASGDRTIEVRQYSASPSPFAFKLLLMGMSDLLLIEDRSVLLRELHADVLAKVMPKADISKPRYDLEEVVDFYTGKRGMLDFNSKQGMLELLERMGPLPLTMDDGRSIIGFTSVAPGTVECWLRELVKEGQVVSMWCHKLVWAHVEHDELLSALYPPPREGDLSDVEIKLLSLIKENTNTAQITVAADKAFKRRGTPMGPQVRDALLDLQVRNALRLATVPTIEEMEAIGAHGEMALDELAEDHPPSESEEEELAEEVTTVEPEILTEDASCEYGASPETEAWEVRTVSTVQVEEAAKWYVRAYLEYYPPGPLSRLAYDLDLDPDLARGTLRDLEDAGEVAAGAFVGGETPQYMLWVDKNTFEGLAKGRRVVRDTVARQFALDKYFHGFEKIEDFFDTFLAAGLPFDIFNRLEDFQLEDWWNLQDSGGVLHGRFVRGHVFFTTAQLAQLLASAYRTEDLDKLDLEVFDTIASATGISAAGVGKALGLKREEVQPSIDKLDRNVYIIRKFIEKKAWSSRNLYLPFELTDPEKEAKKQIIERYIKGTGPLTFTAVRSFTDFCTTPTSSTCGPS